MSAPRPGGDGTGHGGRAGYPLLALTRRRPDGGTVAAVVNPVGAALVGLRVGATDVLQPLADPADPPRCAGATLAPWPSRVRDGTWILDGRAHRLEIDDTARNAAIHGLVKRTPFAVLDAPAPSGPAASAPAECGPAAVTLATTIAPHPGYPFTIALSVTYALDVDGVTVTYRARNAGSGRAAPFAVGAHPYLVVGDHPTGELTLTVPAETVLVFDDRAMPVGRARVAGPLDLRSGRRVADTGFNHCFTDLAARSGEVACTLAGTESTVEIWAGAEFRYWQVYNPADFPGPHGPTRALALEPMTAPPDALNSGTGLRWLRPGGRWSGRWGIRVRPGGTRGPYR